MAKFVAEMPTDVLKSIENIYDNCDKIIGKMTRAGAEVVYKKVKTGVPKGIGDSQMMKNLKLTKTYKTPTDGGINTKVGFYGYFINENGERTPAPLVANLFEYGRSNAPFPKQPFFRKAFMEQDITTAMLKEQEKQTGGLLK